MRWLRWGEAARSAGIWFVLIGTDSDEASLSLVAVTGTWDEGWALLEEATTMAPGLANAVESFPQDRSLIASRPARIARGEKRLVFVVQEARPVDEGPFRFDVFDSREAAAEYARGLTGELQVLEVVTNTWCGAFGAQASES